MRELRKTYVKENPNLRSQHTIQTENKSKKRLVRRLVLFLTFALTVVASISITFYKQHAAVEAQKAEIRKLKKEAEALTAEEKRLQNEIEKLHDDEYIAKIARRDYFFSKPGEVIFPISK
ncbi:MAG: septum formation initiator family protein [Ectobacillus sp.]